MTIPFIDLRPHIEPIRADIDRAIARVVDSGVFLNGSEVEGFEQEWSAYCGQECCVACASGTDALMLLSYRAPGRLLVPANTTPFTVRGLCGRDLSIKPGVLYVDVDERGLPDACKDFVVSLYGRFPVGGMLVDACQAHGWKPPFDSVVAWSFYPTKNLGGFGDGGMVTCSEPTYAKVMREFAARWHSRMDEIQAAVLRVKLKHLDEWNAERARLAGVYYDNLSDTVECVTRPDEPTNHHIFAVLSDRRDDLKRHLAVNGVEAKIHYPEPLAPLPGAISWCERVLSLPMYVGLKDEQVREVCDCIRAFE